MSGANKTGEREVPTLLEAVREDLAQMAKVKGCAYPSFGGLVDILSLPGTWAVLVFRLANTAHYKGLRPLSRLLYFLNIVLFGAELHPSAIVQPGLVIPHPVGVAFGGQCRIGARVMLCRNVALGGVGDPKRPGQPMVGDDVLVFDSAGLFGPVRVGDRSILGRSALVIDDVESDMFVFGARKSHLVRPLSEMGLAELDDGLAELGLDGHADPQAGLTASLLEVAALDGRTPRAR